MEASQKRLANQSGQRPKSLPRNGESMPCAWRRGSWNTRSAGFRCVTGRRRSATTAGGDAAPCCLTKGTGFRCVESVTHGFTTIPRRREALACWLRLGSGTRRTKHLTKHPGLDKLYVSMQLRMVFIRLPARVRWRLMSGETSLLEGTEKTMFSARKAASAAKAKFKQDLKNAPKRTRPAEVHPWRRTTKHPSVPPEDWR